jgi:hypothetical protein
MILINRATDYVWNYYFVTRKFANLIRIFNAFFNIIKVHNSIKIKTVNVDVQRVDQDSEWISQPLSRFQGAVRGQV